MGYAPNIWDGKSGVSMKIMVLMLFGSKVVKMLEMGRKEEEEKWRNKTGLGVALYGLSIIMTLSNMLFGGEINTSDSELVRSFFYGEEGENGDKEEKDPTWVKLGESSDHSETRVASIVISAIAEKCLEVIRERTDLGETLTTEVALRDVENISPGDSLGRGSERVMSQMLEDVHRAREEGSSGATTSGSTTSGSTTSGKIHEEDEG